MFYIVRAVDTFGDTWPLTNRFAGIDGERHVSKEAAQAIVARYKTEQAFRRDLRERNGWQLNSVRKLQISEIVAA